MSILLPENQTELIPMLMTLNDKTDLGFGGMIGLGILFVVAIVSFFSMKLFSYEKAFAPALFLTTVVSFLLRPLGLVNAQIPYIVLAIFLVSLFFLAKESAQQEI